MLVWSEVTVRRDLERGLNPLVSLLPLYLFGSAVLAQLAALAIPLAAMDDIARGVLATAAVVGLVTATILLVDYTTAPVGSVTARLRGLSSASTTGMAVGFILAWYMHVDGAAGLAVAAVELVSYGCGLLGWRAIRTYASTVPAAEDHEDDGWPFNALPVTLAERKIQAHPALLVQRGQRPWHWQG
jgi:hypothetical protein